MEIKQTITYNWWTDNRDIIPTEVREQLQEHAEVWINHMRKNRYTSGELHTEVDGVTYNGHWELTTEVVK